MRISARRGRGREQRRSTGPGSLEPGEDRAGLGGAVGMGTDAARALGSLGDPARRAPPDPPLHLALHGGRPAQPEPAQGPGRVRGQSSEPFRRADLPGGAGRTHPPPAGGRRGGGLLLFHQGPGGGGVAGTGDGAGRAHGGLQPDLAGDAQATGEQRLVGADLPVRVPRLRHHRLQLQAGLRLHRRGRAGAGGADVPARPRAGDAEGLVHPPAGRRGDRDRAAHPSRERLRRAGQEGRARGGAGAGDGQAPGRGVGGPVPHNPFANDLFLPVLLRVVVLLLAGFVAVLVARRRWSLRVLRRSTLFPRTRVWFLIGPLFVVAVFIGGFVSFLLATYVVLQGSSEMARSAGIHGSYVVFLPFGFLILLTLLPILSRALTDAHLQVANTLFAYIYIGLPMAYIVFVKSNEPLGLNFLVVVTIAVAVSDVASWVVGTALRGPRLLQEIAPGKTWSGALGNLLGAAAAVALLWVAVPKSWSIAVVVVLVLMIGLGSLWGDLTDAFVKRAFRTTATSTLVIGYGGVLDRVVSLLMAFPLTYFAVILTQRIMS